MGCLHPELPRRISIEESYYNLLKDAIERESEQSLKKLNELLKKLQANCASILDEPKIRIKTVNLTPLSYAVVKGKASSFKALLKLGSSFEKMYQNFREHSIKPLDLILAKGYKDLFKFFIIEYAGIRDTLNISSDPNPSSSVQVASRKGMLDILRHIYYNYLDTNTNFQEFNLNAFDENGENCALIACRQGILPLIKFFHETCNLNFESKNNFGDNAIIVCIYGFRAKNNYLYKDCVKYLVDYVKVDYTYRHKKMMKLANGEILEYLAEKLEEIGIFVGEGANEEDLNNQDRFVEYGEMFEILCDEGNYSVCNYYPR